MLTSTGVDAMQVAAGTGEIKLRIGTNQSWGFMSSSRRLSGWMADQIARSLVFELTGTDDLMCLSGDVEDKQLFDGSFFVTGHHVLCMSPGLAGGAEGIDDPEIFYFSLIGAGHGEMFGIGTPEQLCPAYVCPYSFLYRHWVSPPPPTCRCRDNYNIHPIGCQGMFNMVLSSSFLRAFHS